MRTLVKSIKFNKKIIYFYLLNCKNGLLIRKLFKNVINHQTCISADFNFSSIAISF